MIIREDVNGECKFQLSRMNHRVGWPVCMRTRWSETEPCDTANSNSMPYSILVHGFTDNKHISHCQLIAPI